jgi:hypothetical protein
VPRLVPRQAPPPDYYADNLSFLLAEVAQRNHDLLTAAEQRLIAGWTAASSSARRLFARLLTRKGPWFRCDQLRYAEVTDSGAAIAELANVALLTQQPSAPADQLLALYTRKELTALFPRVAGSGKDDWIAACVSAYSDTAVRQRLARAGGWIGLADREAWQVCRLLFFGSDRPDLTEFVLQDLGLLRYERYPIEPRTRLFADRGAVDGYLHCRRLAAWFATAEDDTALAGAIRRRLWHPPAARPVARLRDRLLNRMGYLHERRGEFDAALESYALAQSHPARERRARLLKRLGDIEGFTALLARVQAAPWCGAEEDYACRNLIPADTPAAGLSIESRVLDREALRTTSAGMIERHALAELTADGSVGWHLENLFPLGLAGLLFWDEVFAPVPGAFSHPLQQGPHDLFWPDFARQRAAAIDNRLETLAQPGALAARLLEVHAAKHGIANRLVHWGAWTPALVERLAAPSLEPALLRLVRQVIADLPRARTGFPDLTLVDGNERLAFVEIKSPTDQLQPAQRTWLRLLARLELPARVLKYQP